MDIKIIILYITFPLFILLSLLILRIFIFARIPFKLGFRNVFRRLGNTSLVMLGAMVGAALISGSLVLSDSLDKTFLNFVNREVGEVDMTISPKEKQFTQITKAFFQQNELDEISNLIQSAESQTDGILPLWNIQLAPYSLDGEGKALLNAYQVNLYATAQESFDKFGEKPLTYNKWPGKNEAMISRTLADRLELEEGEKLGFKFAGQEYLLEVISIEEDRGILGGPVIFTDLDFFYSNLKFPANSFSQIAISAEGGVEPTNYDGQKFKENIDDTLDKFQSDRISVSSSELKTNALNGFGLDSFVTAFVIMSLFGIFAGILLIINLFAMLAQERKYEMGILRAIALTRGQLVSTFMVEGYFYSIISSILGAFVGLFIGFLLVKGMDSTFRGLFTDVGSDYVPFSVTFGFKWNSLLIAFIAGSVITLLTAIFASIRTGNLNIVAAIRDLEEETKIKFSKKWLVITIFNFLALLGAGLMFLNSFFIEGALKQIRESGNNEMFSNMSQQDFQNFINLQRSYLFYFGVIMGLLLATVFINRILRMAGKEKLINIIVTLSNSAALLFTSFVTRVSFVGESISRDQNSAALFFSFGIVLVVSLSNIITANLDMIARILNFIFSPFEKLTSVVKISLRYPSINKSRTGLTLLMFAIIIYLIVYITYNKSLANRSSLEATESIFGGYDLSIFPSNDVNTEISANLIKDIEKVENVKSVQEILSTKVIMPDYKYENLKERPYFGDPTFKPQYSESDFYATSIDAVPAEFLNNAEIKLVSRSERYATDKDVISALINETDKIILGDNFISEIEGKRPEIKVGEKIRIGDIFGGDTVEKEVIGIVAASPGFSAGGGAGLYDDLIMTTDHLRELLPESYIDNYSSRQILVDFEDINKSFTTTKEVRKAIIGYNIFIVFSVQELASTTQNFINGIILLIQGFLAFSLIVGASGLAIIMARSVNERRQQIGMLRSLGFQRWMVLVSFFIETTLIALLGIIIGVITGTIGAYSAYRVVRDQFDVPFSLPFGEIFILVILIYLASLLFAILPAIKAAKLSPVEATNYPE